MLHDSFKNVTVAGTAEPLSDTSVQIWMVLVQAKAGNLGNIFVGSETIDSTRGHVLAAGESVRLTSEDGVTDLSSVWVDAGTSGEGVIFLYGTPT